MDLTLVVLAAGMGSRFGGLKQMDSFGPNGETIIDYSVYDGIRAGFNKAIFIIRKEFESDFKEIVTSKFDDKIQVEFVFQDLHDLPAGFSVPKEREKPWGTGHAVWVAKNNIKSPFAVINADDFYGKESYQILAREMKSFKPQTNTKHALLGFKLKNTLSDFGPVSRGICKVDEDNLLTEIHEYTKIYLENGQIMADYEGERLTLTGEEMVSMNMMAFSPAVMPILEKYLIDFLRENGQMEKSEFYLPIVLNNLIKDSISKIEVPATTSEWFGVTYKEDKPWVVDSIKALINQKVYPEKLWT